MEQQVVKIRKKRDNDISFNDVFWKNQWYLVSEGFPCLPVYCWKY